MNDETKQIIKALRDYGLHGRDARSDTELKAAKLIKTLSTELDAFESDVREYLKNILIDKSQGHYACYLCKRWEDPYTGKRYTEKRQKCPQDCNGANKWKWRGLCEDNGGTDNDK